MQTLYPVIPAKAGIQEVFRDEKKTLDSGFRRNDGEVSDVISKS